MGQTTSVVEDLSGRLPESQMECDSDSGTNAAHSCYGYYDTDGNWMEYIDQETLLSELAQFEFDSKNAPGMHLFRFFPPPPPPNTRQRRTTDPIYYFGSTVYKDKHGRLDVSYSRYVNDNGQLREVHHFVTPHAWKAAITLLLRKGYTFEKIRSRM